MMKQLPKHILVLITIACSVVAINTYANTKDKNINSDYFNNILEKGSSAQSESGIPQLVASIDNKINARLIGKTEQEIFNNTLMIPTPQNKTNVYQIIDVINAMTMGPNNALNCSAPCTTGSCATTVAKQNTQEQSQDSDLSKATYTSIPTAVNGNIKDNESTYNRIISSTVPDNSNFWMNATTSMDKYKLFFDKNDGLFGKIENQEEWEQLKFITEALLKVRCVEYTIVQYKEAIEEKGTGKKQSQKAASTKAPTASNSIAIGKSDKLSKSPAENTKTYLTAVMTYLVGQDGAAASGILSSTGIDPCNNKETNQESIVKQRICTDNIKALQAINKSEFNTLNSDVNSQVSQTKAVPMLEAISSLKKNLNELRDIKVAKLAQKISLLNSTNIGQINGYNSANALLQNNTSLKDITRSNKVNIHNISIPSNLQSINVVGIMQQVGVGPKNNDPTKSPTRLNPEQYSNRVKIKSEIINKNKKLIDNYELYTTIKNTIDESIKLADKENTPNIKISGDTNTKLKDLGILDKSLPSTIMVTESKARELQSLIVTNNASTEAIAQTSSTVDLMRTMATSMIRTENDIRKMLEIQQQILRLSILTTNQTSLKSTMSDIKSLSEEIDKNIKSYQELGVGSAVPANPMPSSLGGY